MTPRRICSPTMCARTLVPTIPSKCRTIGSTSLDYLKQVTQAIVDYAG